MQLCYDNGVYYAQSAYAELLGETPAREHLKAAGFRWNPDQKQWQTTDSYRARRFLQYADPTCKAHLEVVLAEQERTKALSRATVSALEPPCPPGQAFYPFQRAGVQFCVERPAVILGDDCGNGKTIETLGMLNMLPQVHRVLVVCPNSVKLNWRNEAHAWLLPDLHYALAVVTSKWRADDLRSFYTQLPASQRGIAIINYEILHRFCTVLDFPTAGTKTVQTMQFLDGYGIDQIVIDEAHRMRGNSRQSRAIMSVRAGRKLALSGSPIPNRPGELWNLLHYLDPLYWNNRQQWEEYWIQPQQTALLQEVLRSQYMIRRLKRDVITELPPLQRQILELSVDEAGKDAARIVQAEWDAYRTLQTQVRDLRAAVHCAKAAEDKTAYRIAVALLREGQRVAWREMALQRECTALAKLPQVIEHIRECLETDDKVVVYFWHRSVARILLETFKSACPAIIIGETSLTHRQAAVERFQTDPQCHLFLGSIMAAGEGITLTAASLLLLAEMSWVPKDLAQVEGRLHRITQEHPVLVRYLVFEGSLDASMLKTVVQKDLVIEEVLDTEHDFTVEEIPA